MRGSEKAGGSSVAAALFRYSDGKSASRRGLQLGEAFLCGELRFTQKEAGPSTCESADDEKRTGRATRNRLRVAPWTQRRRKGGDRGQSGGCRGRQLYAALAQSSEVQRLAEHES
jgi:hypothetical protein